MSDTLIFSFAKVFNLIFGDKTDIFEDTTDDTADQLARAQNKLDKGICPSCDMVTSIGMVADGADDGASHVCGKCGQRLSIDDTGTLLGLMGYEPNIQAKFLADQAVEAELRRDGEEYRRRVLTHTLDSQARKAA